MRMQKAQSPPLPSFARVRALGNVTSGISLPTNTGLQSHCGVWEICTWAPHGPMGEGDSSAGEGQCCAQALNSSWMDGDQEAGLSPSKPCLQPETGQVSLGMQGTDPAILGLDVIRPSWQLLSQVGEGLQGTFGTEEARAQPTGSTACASTAGVDGWWLWLGVPLLLPALTLLPLEPLQTSCPATETGDLCRTELHTTLLA
jgi:hypothetical protein